jgi:hypothetical protein
MKLMKHKQCTDTAILVLGKLLIPERGVYRLKVRWINIVNPLNHFDLGVTDTLYIKEKTLKEDWHELHQMQGEN